MSKAKLVSQHHMASHEHFHGHQFSLAKFLFIRTVFHKCAVATATWQH